MLAMLLLLLARSALFVRRWLRSMRIVLGVSKCVSESLVAVTTASLVELWCRGKRGAAMSSILHFPGSWLRDSAIACELVGKVRGGHLRSVPVDRAQVRRRRRRRAPQRRLRCGGALALST